MTTSKHGYMYPPSPSHSPQQLQHPGSTCTLLDVYSVGLDNYTFELSRKKFEGICSVHRGWCVWQRSGSHNKPTQQLDMYLVQALLNYM